MLITTIILFIAILISMPFLRKVYIPYVKDNPNKLWFKRKLYGWGWTPVTSQGWTVTAIYVFLVFALAFTIDQYSTDKELLFTFLLPVILLTICFMRIAYTKGEKPHWQWGIEKKKEEDNKTNML